MSRLATPGRRLDDLTPHPGGGRASRHVDMHQLASTMRDEDEHVQGLEGESRDAEQVGRPQVVGMVAQKGAPCLARRARWSSPAIPANGPVADDDAELEQLTSDPLGAPQPILARYGRDQLPHLGTQMRASTSSESQI